MTPNHKLTQVIKGRKIVGTSNADGKMTVTFDDGSTMKIKTGAADVGAATEADATDASVSSTRSSQNVASGGANATATNATATNTTETSATVKADPLLALNAKRNDVFRNLKWSEEKFQDDATRLSAPGSAAYAEIIDEAIPAASIVRSVSSNASNDSASTGGTVQSVMQGEIAMTLHFEDGGELEIPLAEASSSVMLRDKNNTMEYAD